MPLSGLNFVQGAVIAASESDGVYYSKDVGNTWQKRAAFKSGQVNALGASADGATVAIATPSVVAVSTDAGATGSAPKAKRRPASCASRRWRAGRFYAARSRTGCGGIRSEFVRFIRFGRFIRFAPGANLMNFTNLPNLTNRPFTQRP